MANPKRKTSPSRRDSRRAQNWKISATNASSCPQCGAARIPHRICGECGFYNGELVIPKKTKKKKEGEAQGQPAEGQQ